jgi:hypothetical protein
MKTSAFSDSLKVTAIAVALVCGAGARAAAIPTAPRLNPSGMSQGGLQAMAFRDSAEADMLRKAYRTLATGDHDYNGHRIKAMHAVEAAAKLLGMDLSGDLKDRTPQPLSDDKLREAQGLISQVLGAAEVKGQKRVVKHLNVAVENINTALKIR